MPLTSNRTQQMANEPQNQGECQLQSTVISRQNSSSRVQQSNTQAELPKDCSSSQFLARLSKGKSPKELMPKYLPLRQNQKIAAEKSVQNAGSMRLSDGFAARSKTPLISRSLKNVDTSSSNNDFKISTSINLNSSQVRLMNKKCNLQTE